MPKSYKALLLIIGTVGWIVAGLVAIVLQKGGVGLVHQVENQLGLFIRDLMTYAAIGYLSAAVLARFVQIEKRFLQTWLLIVAYLIIMPVAVFSATLGHYVMPVIGPIIFALVPLCAAVILGFMCAKIWVLATPERSV